MGVLHITYSQNAITKTKMHKKRRQSNSVNTNERKIIKQCHYLLLSDNEHIRGLSNNVSETFLTQ